MAEKRRNGNAQSNTSPVDMKKVKREKVQMLNKQTMELDEQIQHSDVYPEQWKSLAGWFLGPRAENRVVLNQLIMKSLNHYEDFRENYYTADPCYITEEVKASQACRGEIKDLTEQVDILNEELKKSLPTFSTRYQGRMAWETTMPATLGYLTGMMWNQNNVGTTTISPVTAAMSMEVGKQLCKLMQFSVTEEIKPWAHIIGYGSAAANVEAMWAASNLKLHPIAIKACVLDADADPLLKKGAMMKVLVPALDTTVALKDCTNWMLMNLDIDTVCNLTTDLMNFCRIKDIKKIEIMLKKHSVISVGLVKFMLRHHLENTPVFLCPGTSNYAYSKVSTVLGLGDENVIQLKLDRNARVNLEDLRKRLEFCLVNKIPIMAVVAVIGSIDESAVDPICEMLQIRQDFKKKGLNFAIHADATQGGYLMTMLCEPTPERLNMLNERDPSFVPEISLSPYVTRQYNAIKLADTVTIDPHSTGFCQSPVSALAYRNGMMRTFVKMVQTPVQVQQALAQFKDQIVYQKEALIKSQNEILVKNQSKTLAKETNLRSMTKTDLKSTYEIDEVAMKSICEYGLDSSTPGATASGVLLAHRVIGLDKLGFGRILGQCQLGAKLSYCMWMTACQEYDDFECMNLIDLPKDIGMTTDMCKTFIKERILGRDNHELIEDKKALNFLKLVGPDALVNAFTVNIKGNTNTAVCNKLHDILFSELNGKLGYSARRVPLFLEKSVFEREQYGEAMLQLKHRLGLNMDDDVTTLAFLRNVSMNPFQASERFITNTACIFRNAIKNSIAGLGGKYGDEPIHHSFVISGLMNSTGKIFIDYMPYFCRKETQYNVVLSMTATTRHEMEKFIQQQDQTITMYVRTKRKITMMDLLRNTPGAITMDVYKGDMFGTPVFAVDMQVCEVYRYHHIDSKEIGQHLEYPTHQQYFLYGDKERAFISHMVTKFNDFHQVIELDEIPHSVPEVLLDLGVVITIPTLSGKPLVLGNKISDPLQSSSYVVDFNGIQNTACKTTIMFTKQHSKKYFDATYLNTGNMQ